MRRPGGASAPATMVRSDGSVIDLLPLAQEICALFYAAFPEELERSGEAGTEWCRHDNQYLLAWAIQEARDGTVSLSDQAVWLARVLDQRGFPIELLAKNLLIASDLVRNRDELGDIGQGAADALAAGAVAVREVAMHSERNAAPE
jgi:hypothetical protein